MGHNYRCTLRKKCGARKTLNKAIGKYTKIPLCPACKKDTLKSVNEKEKARSKRRLCQCDGYYEPHNKGQEPWCESAVEGPTDEDHMDRHRSL